MIKRMNLPAEDFIYSTLCFVKCFFGGVTRTWKTHVLMTTKALAFLSYHGRNPTVNFVSWKYVKIRSAGFSAIGCRFKFIREVNFETKEGFKKRSKEFKSKFKPIRQAGKEYWLTKTKEELKAELDSYLKFPD
jgi:hypothetical protein